MAQTSGGWLGQIQSYRQRLEGELNVCATVKTPVTGSKLYYGTNGFNHGGNLGKVTLANDGLPGQLNGENKATIGYSFGEATPAGGLTGGVEYNPANGAVKVSGGPAWGLEAPKIPLGAEVSIEAGVTYTPPAPAQTAR